MARHTWRGIRLWAWMSVLPTLKHLHLPGLFDTLILPHQNSLPAKFLDVNLKMNYAIDFVLQDENGSSVIPPNGQDEDRWRNIVSGGDVKMAGALQPHREHGQSCSYPCGI